MKNESKKVLSPDQYKEILNTLEIRFNENMNRHKNLEWGKVKAKLESNEEKLWTLNEMEKSGGEPDVVYDDSMPAGKTGEFIFYDCSAESPKGRRSLCYDREALEARKEHKPKNNVIDVAAELGIEILTEEQYRDLQKIGNFDLKDFKLDKNPFRNKKSGWCPILRSPL